MKQSLTDIQAKILIVDDSEANLQVLGHALLKNGYHVTIANSGKQCLKLVSGNIHDLILLDINMPEMDGFEVIRQLKGNEQTKDIPVIFLTARTQTEDIVNAFSEGAVDYITKPFNLPELLSRVNTHVRLRKTEETLKISQLRYKKISELITDYAFSYSLENQENSIMLWNTGYPQSLTSFIPENVLKAFHLSAVINAEDIENYNCHKNKIKEGFANRVILKINGFDEQPHWISLWEQPEPTKNINFFIIYGAISDITIQKKAEIEIQQQYQKIKIQNQEIEQVNQQLLKTTEILSKTYENLSQSHEAFKNLLHHIQAAINVRKINDNELLFSNHYADINGLSDVNFYQLFAQENKQTVAEENNGKFMEYFHKYNEKWYYCYTSEMEWIDNSLVTIEFAFDITEKKVAQQTIENAFNKEKELNNLKSRFISTVSHEFRTPLAGIVSNLYILKKHYNKMDEDKLKRTYDRIFYAVNNITNMVDEITLSSKDQSGKLIYQPVFVNFEEYFFKLANEIFVNYSLDMELNLQIESNVGEIAIDTNLFKIVINNLFSNAIKYSGENKIVDCSVKNISQTHFQIMVRDYGIGIPEKDLEKIFEPFHRAENVENIQGTGLGMSIVKRCVELHKGDIEIHSKKNEGTTIIIEIPIIKQLNYEENCNNRG